MALPRIPSSTEGFRTSSEHATKYIGQALREGATLKEVFFACVGLGIPDPMDTAEILVGDDLLNRTAKLNKTTQELQANAAALEKRIMALKECDPCVPAVASALYTGMMELSAKKDVTIAAVRIAWLTEKLRNLGNGIPLHVTPRPDEPGFHEGSGTYMTPDQREAYEAGYRRGKADAATGANLLTGTPRGPTLEQQGDIATRYRVTSEWVVKFENQLASMKEKKLSHGQAGDVLYAAQIAAVEGQLSDLRMEAKVLASLMDVTTTTPGLELLNKADTTPVAEPKPSDDIPF